MKKFMQVVSKRQQATEDNVGNVVVQVFLSGRGHPIKGNISKRITLKDARVSEVLESLKELIVDE